VKKEPRPIGGIIHTYQKYDPQNFPSPTQPPPDMVSSAFEHLLMYGGRRRLTEEELARAIRLRPDQIAGLGPSLDALLAILLERKRKILATYETETVLEKAVRHFRAAASGIQIPDRYRAPFERAVRQEQILDLERLWYALDREGDREGATAARKLVPLMEIMGHKYLISEMAAKYEFHGHTALTVLEALALKEELEKIDRLIEQLRQAQETAQIAVIDMEALAEYTEPGDLEQLNEFQKTLQKLIRDLAEQQGLETGDDGRIQLTPRAYRLFQGRLLERIFSELQESRTGRHSGPVTGEGAVELQATKPYEFGDSLAHIDLPQSLLNALLRRDGGERLRLTPEDIVVHRTRNNPKCATVVIMDMSGSMRYDGQYVNVKRMALALDGLIRREYPGDFLRFFEMYSFAKPCPPGEIVNCIPKPVTLYEPIVRLKVDMSRPEVSEFQIPSHFTNMQHALRMARQSLATQDTPNRQVLLITDGLPTAHFEDQTLYMLYPPDIRTEQATMREALQCQRDGITINMFLVPSWSQSEEDIRFAYRIAETTRGRVFFTAGNELERFVVWDYVKRKREILA